ncbi:Uncharacterised protein [Mycobacteroides abscessus subsp. abscessus]|nr:Uncharacterised protein [Mycobacteroides abscessus subsp. abscessus]SHT95425.1 Uncharacterised protein [Mycobacteroides abscessus subsp. abscessus]SHV93150.1 Uncharacterised protein [Mycobacteroides abscessus subsp. abscessus]SIC87658.1 Uncharacterised protein [Mycobacteroides abscessus subsp. abscessus]SKP74585.1 Uncharacterised protein [Mycobacteroides abscessus subsp. abscessus]
MRSATVCIVSFLNSPTYIGMPVWVALITPVAFVLIGLWTMRKKGPHPATYNMNDGWTHGPILWAAVDENIGDAHGHGHGHGHAGAEAIGGSASGKW